MNNAATTPATNGLHFLRAIAPTLTIVWDGSEQWAAMTDEVEAHRDLLRADDYDAFCRLVQVADLRGWDPNSASTENGHRLCRILRDLGASQLEFRADLGRWVRS